MRPIPMIEPTAIAIFAKAPLAGFAKTRLIPLLGPEGASALQAQLVARAVAVARAAELGPVSLWCTPDIAHESFKAIAADCGIELFKQAPGDLGDKMGHTFEVLGRNGAVLLMGTDCVAISPDHLRKCAESIRRGADAVFLPVEDGGYILVGLKRPAPEIFREIPWNTDGVMSVTRERAANAGLRIAEPATLWDIDRPEDYRRAVREGLLPASGPQIAGR
jgi:rSAM/selenodomain-associated transferase 1